MASIQRFDTLAELSLAAAQLVVSAAHQAVADRGRFSLVLAGGTTPAPLYRLLASPPHVDQMPWANTLLFWGDERCVPPEHPASNFRLAHETLLASGLVPEANIFPMAGVQRDPEEAAREYQQTILTRLGSAPFDLVLLGMGSDGHIASLFPGSPLLEETHRLVAGVVEPSGRPPLPRVTLTLPALNRSRQVVLLINGTAKAEILQTISQSGGHSPYPAAMLRPMGSLTWLVAREESLPARS